MPGFPEAAGDAKDETKTEEKTIPMVNIVQARERGRKSRSVIGIWARADIIGYEAGLGSRCQPTSLA